LGEEEAMTDPNKRFAELVGILYSTVRHPIGCKCEEMRFHCPDFTDAREVLKVMDEDTKVAFIMWLVNKWISYGNVTRLAVQGYCVRLSTYFEDTTGLLRDEAIKWMEGRK
jgi:hypothetical protein